jgi:hypothetical protein
MSEVRFVDVTYRGLRVAQRARCLDAGGGALFVEHEAPLPVGSTVAIIERAAADGSAGPVDAAPARRARVAAVVEQEAGAKSPPGMRLELVGEATSRAAERPAGAPVAVTVPVTVHPAPAPVPATAAAEPTPLPEPTVIPEATPVPDDVDDLFDGEVPQAAPAEAAGGDSRPAPEPSPGNGTDGGSRRSRRKRRTQAGRS